MPEVEIPNPQARNLFEINGYLPKREGIHFEVRAIRYTVESQTIFFDGAKSS